jgi:hypothetical protein
MRHLSVSLAVSTGERHTRIGDNTITSAPPGLDGSSRSGIVRLVAASDLDGDADVRVSRSKLAKLAVTSRRE